jgi:hypothetical protein
MVWCIRMESKKLMSLYVWRVVGLLYVESHQHFYNLTDMHQKPLVCFGLHMGMVPNVYQQKYVPKCSEQVLGGIDIFWLVDGSGDGDRGREAEMEKTEVAMVVQ